MPVAASARASHFNMIDPFEQTERVLALLAGRSLYSQRHHFLDRVLHGTGLSGDLGDAALDKSKIWRRERSGRDFHAGKGRLDGRECLPNYFLMRFNAL